MVAPGEILGGKYQVERVLGHGGMGLVLAARHVHLDQRVAIKVLNKEYLSQPAIVERFLREARASVRLRSEHVARVLDAGRFDDGMPFMVMEHLEGRDLAAELAQVHRLPVATAVELVLQACEAVAEAHDAGIIHRDLKPSNMFLTRDSDGAPLLKVLDFGISKVEGDPSSDLTSTKMVMGSPPYMSPEQLRTSRSVDARADVWSLGVVLYELVSGRRPFVGVTLTDLLLRISGDPPDPLMPDAPPGLAAVIARCLAKLPAERYASIAELAGALASYAGPRGALRVDRIRRRTSAVVAAESVSLVPEPGDQRTTLSSATGAIEPGAARRWARPVMIGVALAALAVSAAVAMWPARNSTLPVSAPGAKSPAPGGPDRRIDRGLPPPPAAAAAPVSGPGDGAAATPTVVAPGAQRAVTPPALPSAGATPATTGLPVTTEAPATSERPATTGPRAADAPSSTAVAPRDAKLVPPADAPAGAKVAPRPVDPRRVTASPPASAPKSLPPPARRAPSPSGPVEDLTKSQY